MEKAKTNPHLKKLATWLVLKATELVPSLAKAIEEDLQLGAELVCLRKSTRIVVDPLTAVIQLGRKNRRMHCKSD
jgi:hypothetical protein